MVLELKNKAVIGVLYGMFVLL